VSTLKFAQRAKQVRNRAVINESSEGNVQQLRAEIERLRQLLQGGGPQQQQQVLHSALTPDQRDDLLQMAMEQQTNAVAACKALHGRIAAMEELLQRRDQALQASKMIVKFRDAAIVRLEQAAAGRLPPTAADGDRESLQAELAALRAQAAHADEAARLAVENADLRETVESLRRRYGGGAEDVGKERDVEMERLHLYCQQLTEQVRDYIALKQSMREARGDCESPSDGGASPRPGAHVATATGATPSNFLRERAQRMERDKLRLEDELAACERQRDTALSQAAAIAAELEIARANAAAEDAAVRDRLMRAEAEAAGCRDAARDLELALRTHQA
jgi:hypothetical protein